MFWLPQRLRITSRIILCSLIQLLRGANVSVLTPHRWLLSSEYITEKIRGHFKQKCSHIHISLLPSCLTNWYPYCSKWNWILSMSVPCSSNTHTLTDSAVITFGGNNLSAKCEWLQAMQGHLISSHIICSSAITATRYLKLSLILVQINTPAATSRCNICSATPAPVAAPSCRKDGRKVGMKKPILHY